MSSGGREKQGRGLPGSSSQLKGTEAMSLTGSAMVGVTEEDIPRFQSFLAIPGFSESHIHG